VAGEPFTYDVAFSLLNRDEPLARKIERLLRPLAVFLFTEQQEKIAGTDGIDTFSRVFAREARIVAVLYRGEWGKTRFTRIEESALKRRAFEDGQDFLTFVPLDNTELPLWLDPQRLWLDLERLGPKGVAAVLKERVARAGRVVREETAEELAQRIDQEREWRERRENILRSPQALEATDNGFDALLAAVTRIAQATRLQVHQERSGGPFDIFRGQSILQIYWPRTSINRAATTPIKFVLLDRLAVDFVERARAHTLARYEFVFDVLPSEDTGWRGEDGRFYGPDSLAEHAVKLLLKQIEEAEDGDARRRRGYP
jgi:hypothetical protein